MTDIQLRNKLRMKRKIFKGELKREVRDVTGIFMMTVYETQQNLTKTKLGVHKCWEISKYAL